MTVDSSFFAFSDVLDLGDLEFAEADSLDEVVEALFFAGFAVFAEVVFLEEEIPEDDGFAFFSVFAEVLLFEDFVLLDFLLDVEADLLADSEELLEAFEEAFFFVTAFAAAVLAVAFADEPDFVELFAFLDGDFTAVFTAVFLEEDVLVEAAFFAVVFDLLEPVDFAVAGFFTIGFFVAVEVFFTFVAVLDFDLESAFLDVGTGNPFDSAFEAKCLYRYKYANV